MMYRAWLRVQLAFWLTVGWFEKQYRLFQAWTTLRSLKKKGIITQNGWGMKATYDFTDFGLAVRQELLKTTVRPEDVR